MEKNQIPNIDYIVKTGLCVGCGVCQDACPQSAIKIVATEGVFRPEVDYTHCINDKGCHRCRTACPGGGIRLAELTKKHFASENNIIHRQAHSRLFWTLQQL